MKLRDYRKLQNLTQTKFAKLIGATSYVIIARYESGVRVPSPTAMRKIYEVTGGKVTPNDFVLPQ